MVWSCTSTPRDHPSIDRERERVKVVLGRYMNIYLHTQGLPFNLEGKGLNNWSCTYTGRDHPSLDRERVKLVMSGISSSRHNPAFATEWLKLF